MKDKNAKSIQKKFLFLIVFYDKQRFGKSIQWKCRSLDGFIFYSKQARNKATNQLITVINHIINVLAELGTSVATRYAGNSRASVPLLFPIASVKLAPPLFLSFFEVSALSASLALRPEKTINYHNHFRLCKKFKTLHWFDLAMPNRAWMCYPLQLLDLSLAFLECIKFWMLFLSITNNLFGRIEPVTVRLRSQITS